MDRENNPLFVQMNEEQKELFFEAINIIRDINNVDISKHILEIEVALINMITKKYYDPEIPPGCDSRSIEGMLSYAKNGVLFISTKWWRIPYLALQIAEINVS